MNRSLEEVGDTEPTSGCLKILEVEVLLLNAEDRNDVAPLPIRNLTTIAVPTQFPKHLIFGGRYPQFGFGRSTHQHAHPSINLATIKDTVTKSEHVDLQPGGEADEVE
jgi:hypothetical protein